MYQKICPLNGTEEITRRVEVPAGLPYADMADYIRAWPDKLVSFVAEHLCDDGMEGFARELYGYICVGDAEGPPFEEWRL